MNAGSPLTPTIGIDGLSTLPDRDVARPQPNAGLIVHVRGRITGLATAELWMLDILAIGEPLMEFAELSGEEALQRKFRP